MPMISTIGRKNFKVRLLISGIYLLLILGSVTMVYPFMLMIAGSTKSSVDLNELRVVPGFLTQQDTLYRKYLEGLFNEKMDLFKLTYDVEDSSFETAKLPTQINDQLVDAWDDYLQQANLNTHTSMVGMMAQGAAWGFGSGIAHSVVGSVLGGGAGGDVGDLFDGGLGSGDEGSSGDGSDQNDDGSWDI